MSAEREEARRRAFVEAVVAAVTRYVPDEAAARIFGAPAPEPPEPPSPDADPQVQLASLRQRVAFYETHLENLREDVRVLEAKLAPQGPKDGDP